MLCSLGNHTLPVGVVLGVIFEKQRTTPLPGLWEGWLTLPWGLRSAELRVDPRSSRPELCLRKKTIRKGKPNVVIEWGEK